MGEYVVSNPVPMLLMLQQESERGGPRCRSLPALATHRPPPAVLLGDSHRIWIRRSDLERLGEQSIGWGQVQLGEPILRDDRRAA